MFSQDLFPQRRFVTYFFIFILLTSTTVKASLLGISQKHSVHTSRARRNPQPSSSTTTNTASTTDKASFLLRLRRSSGRQGRISARQTTNGRQNWGYSSWCYFFGGCSKYRNSYVTYGYYRYYGSNVIRIQKPYHGSRQTSPSSASSSSSRSRTRFRSSSRSRRWYSSDSD